MCDIDVHVTKDKDAFWIVAHGDTFGLGRFRLRSHALAFGRAVAHSSKVEMVVHESDGRRIRHPATSLTYPSSIS
jgi:Uncharacterized protein conserved in bacteria (DUF2188)